MCKYTIHSLGQFELLTEVNLHGSAILPWDANSMADQANHVCQPYTLRSACWQCELLLCRYQKSSMWLCLWPIKSCQTLQEVQCLWWTPRSPLGVMSWPMHRPSGCHCARAKENSESSKWWTHQTCVRLHLLCVLGVCLLVLRHCVSACHHTLCRSSFVTILTCATFHVLACWEAAVPWCRKLPAEAVDWAYQTCSCSSAPLWCCSQSLDTSFMQSTGHCKTILLHQYDQYE